MTKIAVVLPTRGFVFTEVEIALTKNLQKYRPKIYRSYGVPLPDCENMLVDLALKNAPDYILMVEEDTVLPNHGLKAMLSLKADIACIDYGVAGWGCVTKSKDTGEILWCGLGCTLIKREVFEALEKPYFRTDQKLSLNSWPEIVWQEVPPHRLATEYGGQDIWFCMQARSKGFKIAQVEDMECRHLKIDSLGTPGVNGIGGERVISEKPRITNRQTI